MFVNSIKLSRNRLIDSSRISDSDSFSVGIENRVELSYKRSAKNPFFKIFQIINNSQEFIFFVYIKNLLSEGNISKQRKHVS